LAYFSPFLPANLLILLKALYLKDMQTSDPRYSNYLSILREELIPAMGCTEPVSLAYAAALARQELGKCPERVLLELSGNFVKNVKNLVVPNTGGRKGMAAAVAAGIVAGKPEKKLEVIAQVTEKEKEAIGVFLKAARFEVKRADTERVFEITITLFSGDSYAKVRIIDSHTNVVLIEKDRVILRGPEKISREEAFRNLLSVEGIVDFAESVKIEDVGGTIEPQIACNSAIAWEGLAGNYGANIGSTLLEQYGRDIKTRAKAMAAAGSDARMGGCEMPVIILAGSGNQGMTASLPVIEYARELDVGRESLIRALVISSLTTIHLKTGIRRLSAFCGMVSAGAGAGAGIAYLQGGGTEEIAHTIVNALTIVSGVVCDGAKPSCAAKIAASVDAGILGYEMYKSGRQFYGGNGIMAQGVESAIRTINRLDKKGMKGTDKELLKIMLTEE
jgi:L-cysteine desulfidase